MHDANTSGLIGLPVIKEKVERSMADQRWEVAREAAVAGLALKPSEHWFLERLAAAEYQLGNYAESLSLADRALASEPQCFLATWDRAEALYALGDVDAALEAYGKLTQAGVDGIMSDMCNEGREWAQALVSDSFYRSARLLAKQGLFERSAAFLETAIALRREGLDSLYPLQELRDVLAYVTSKSQSSPPEDA
jgi:tetratricopeptide (TPR) repeat protein